TSPRSIVRAFAGTRTCPAAPTAVIMLSVTTTTAFAIGALPVPSISRAAFRTTVPVPTGGSGVIRAEEVCATTETQTEWTTNNAVTSLSFFTVSRLNRSRKTSRGILVKILIKDEPSTRDRNRRSESGVDRCEKPLRGNSVEPENNIRRTAGCVARDRDRDNQLLTVKRQEVWST